MFITPKPDSEAKHDGPSAFPGLSANEKQAMTAWMGCDEDYGYLSFSGVAARSSLAPNLVRRTVRALARKQMLKFGKGLWSDEGEMRGSGYGLTSAGQSYVERLDRAAAHAAAADFQAELKQREDLAP